LMAALTRKTAGRARFAGVGGPQSEAQGLKSLYPMSDLSVMGLAEVLPHLPRLVRRINQTAAEARCRGHGGLRELLHAAGASAPRLGHSHRALRRPATLGLASRPRQEA